MDTYVYIDGFNLYYGALKGSPYRWLDIKALISRLLPSNYQTRRIKYFTARVSGAADPDAPRRQAIYLSALRTVPEVEIHYGNFLSKTIWRPVMNLPLGGHFIDCPNPVALPSGTHPVPSLHQQLVVGNYPTRGGGRARNIAKPLPNAVITEIHTMEEKGSDVNLGAHLINDAWKNIYDAAVVVSNDTDLVTPIRMVTQERRKIIFIVCPGRWVASPRLTRVATYVRHIHPAMLSSSQFPTPIPGTTIRKPAGW
jgi:uncharacterized LabA/DUF88 family protein